MSNYFQLDVSNNEGLSYAIDRALDKEFNQNITISDAGQWQSIFNIIQQDQAEQTQKNQKQFTEKDTDVTNGQQYVVQPGKYNLTINTWNTIVDFVKTNVLKTPKEEKTEVKTDDKILSDTSIKSNEENLRDILSNANIEISEEDFLDVLSKYENKIALQTGGMDISNVKIEQDILAYIMGKQYEKTEDTFYNQTINKILPNDSNATNETYVLEGVKKGLEYAKQNPNNPEGAYKLNSEGYQQFGNAQIQLYDESGDNLVDYNEFVSYEQKRSGIEYDTEEKAAAQKVFNYLDMDSNGYIDSTEMTLNGYAMSKLSDSENVRTGASISYKDWWATQTMLAGLGTDEQDENYLKAKNRYDELRNLGKEVVYNYKKHLK